jgi:hypothetical protein
MSVEILRNVLALGAVVEAGAVLVDVYGSTANVCGSIRFAADETQQQQIAGRIEEWAQAGTPLTYVRRGTSVSLQDDTVLYGGQLQPSP